MVLSEWESIGGDFVVLFCFSNGTFWIFCKYEPRNMKLRICGPEWMWIHVKGLCGTFLFFLWYFLIFYNCEPVYWKHVVLSEWESIRVDFVVLFCFSNGTFWISNIIYSRNMKLDMHGPMWERIHKRSLCGTYFVLLMVLFKFYIIMNLETPN